MGVVIVVPAFAKREKRDPPIIAGIVSGGEAAVAPHVGCGIDQPGGMQADDDAQATAPENERKSANGI